MRVVLYYIGCCFIVFENFLSLMISLIIPKSKKYVVVGGWNGYRYADNSRAFFEYLDEHKRDLNIKKVFWYTKDWAIYKELKKEQRDVLYGVNLKSIFWHYRSKVHIIDQYPKDLINFCSVRCIRIHLFHGIAIKKIYNYMRPKMKYCNSINRLWSRGLWRDHYILVTSEWVKNIYSFAFGVGKNKCIKSSYPRNRYLYIDRKRTADDKVFNVFYLPTFRDNKTQNPFFEIDLYKLNEELKKNNIHFYIKAHFVDKTQWNNSLQLSNIFLLDTKCDVYDFLQDMDLLITDYSSVFYDFTLTNRPILFFPYDLEYYDKSDRGFILPYFENTPGKKVFTVHEMVNSIFDIRLNYEGYFEQYREIYEKIKKWLMNTL